MEIRAYAGPMDLERAQTFRRKWKTPPRMSRIANHSTNFHTEAGSPNCHAFRLLDVEKGLERVGRWGVSLCLRFKVFVGFKIELLGCVTN